jgi:hypothetical protein
MKPLLSIIGTAAILLCGGCATTTGSASSKVYSGTYFYNFESSSFTPDGIGETWCLNGNMEQAELPAKGASGPWGTARVVVRGTLSPPGHYCNLGASKYVLTVSQVLRVSDKRAQEP